jgi:signal transduction histidine kinase
LRAIEAESKRLNRIATDLLLLAELEAGEKAKKDLISLRLLVMREIGRSQLLAGTRQIVAGQLPDLFVRGDEHKLGLALSNLVENAVKYTAESGIITVSLVLEGEWARLEVADNGIGIAGQDLPHLFDRFYRVDKARSGSGRGTGLGLAIVKGIVEKHGGKITVASQIGKGSIFTLWLKL